MRYIELKESEKSILKEKMRSRISFREQQRIHCIILSSKKYKIGELSDIFEVDRDTIARWLDWWEEDGQAGLKDAVKRGRPCILTEEESKEVIKLVEENPRQLNIMEIFNGESIQIERGKDENFVLCFQN